MKLTVPLAPEHVRQRLADLGAGRDRLREYRFGVGDIEGKDDRRAADRGRGEHPHLGELIRQVQQPAADAQPDRHQPPAGDRDPVEFLGAEGVPVESGSAVGALDNDMRGDRHDATVGTPRRLVLNVLAA